MPGDPFTGLRKIGSDYGVIKRWRAELYRSYFNLEGKGGKPLDLTLQNNLLLTGEQLAFNLALETSLNVS